MKLALSITALSLLSLAACTTETSTTSTTDTAVVAPVGDPNMVTTTTTTTTTRPAYQPRPDVKYLDLRTKQMITVRVDTVHHYIVNNVTNEPVDFFIEPGSTDTVYGRNMRIANGLINYGSGSSWTYDESLINAASNNTSSSDASSQDNDTAMMNGKEISKIKTNGNETKIKYKDGSKIKTNGEETKIKNK